MAYTSSDLQRTIAEYKNEMADCDDRRGRYSNIPTEAERERELYLEAARKAETVLWNNFILPGIVGVGYSQAY